METSIIKIGNSQGLIIPKKILHDLGDSKRFDMQVKDGVLVILPCDNQNPRNNWEQQFDKAIKNGFKPESNIEYIENDFDKEEWTW